MRQRFHYVNLLMATVCVACTTPAPPAAEHVGAATAMMGDQDLKRFQLRTLETHIQTMPEGPERDYFSGMLAAGYGRFDDAIAQLNRALPRLRESAPRRAAMALDTIATAYSANNQYGDAARTYAELFDHFAARFKDLPRGGAVLARILSGTHPQTISWHGPVRLKTSNLAGTPAAELVVNGVRGLWLLDTGASYSLVSRTFAERLGAMPLQGVTSVRSGATGLPSSVRVAVLPTMQLGGATLTNVVLEVIDDADLRLGRGPRAYQIDAVLGYPVFKALGVVTFTGDEFLAGQGVEAHGQRARMYMQRLQPVIECDVEGRPLPFSFDTGGLRTSLSGRYYESFPALADSWKTRDFEIAGVGGWIRQTGYVQARVVMKVGTSTVTLQNVPIFPVRMNGEMDPLFGTIGMDFVDSFESVSLNFSTMTFSFGAPRRVQ